MLTFFRQNLGPYYWAGALAGRFGRFPAYLQGWVLWLGLIGGVAGYEYQLAEQLIAMRLIWANARLDPPTPPGALGDVSSVPFGVPLPNANAPRFQLAVFGIMAGFSVFHCACNFLSVRLVNKLAIGSFVWLLMASVLLIIVLPCVAPYRADGSFVFLQWISVRATRLIACGVRRT